jgi:hypothetical protein
VFTVSIIHFVGGEPGVPARLDERGARPSTL